MINYIFYYYIEHALEPTLEKIVRQNNKIILKLDDIISRQKSLELKVSKIEERRDNDINNDAEFIKVSIKI
jgi:molybdopterin-guanine dinucleotide biosynthesis protein A